MQEPTLGDIAQQLSEIKHDIQSLEKRFDGLEEEVKRWDERFFQLTRDNLNTARTIIITAGAAVILSPVLQAFAPAIQSIVSRLSGAGTGT
ncbi:hypothetical protein [Leptothermofonsia sp. ETS-13]|jgi:predicted nuclease with TOPRIM domain|uniref:hypothetical protein n=1 Tax=Leptothermofonsia sp. ETS-13 TaxID=3035696 RepID=UPI0028F77CA4|nr:hypothetical protein [Leptolyngbyaceae cyanobacterium HOT.MB2.61]